MGKAEVAVVRIGSGWQKYSSQQQREDGGGCAAAVQATSEARTGLEAILTCQPAYREKEGGVGKLGAEGALHVWRAKRSLETKDGRGGKGDLRRGGVQGINCLRVSANFNFSTQQLEAPGWLGFLSGPCHLMANKEASPPRLSTSRENMAR